MTLSVDINCDMGESFGVYRIGEDEAVLQSITSANVACGFHGGDPRTMRRTVRWAQERGVGVGAHPGFADLVGFGRRNLAISEDEAYTDALYQIGAIAAFAKAAGMPLQHVKPHGQLNNLAMRNRALADAIVAAVADFDKNIIFVAYGGEMRLAAEAAGLRVAHEVYADREYMPDGTLVPRAQPGSVIKDPERIVGRAAAMVKTGRITAMSGETLAVRVDTICVHGDTPGAAAIAAALRQGLEAEGIAVKPMAAVLQGRA